jgi:DNA-binding transcriptional MocR family regulator
MKQRIRLTESQLHQLIQDCVNESLMEREREEMDENWLKDKVNQTRSALKTFTNRDKDASMSQRFSNAKKNWNSQGELNGFQNLRDQLSQYLDAGQIDPQTTVAQLVGGKYNGNKFGKLTGQIANRRAQISNRGGNAY